jgi:hypothetical protein
MISLIRVLAVIEVVSVIADIGLRRQDLRSVSHPALPFLDRAGKGR